MIADWTVDAGPESPLIVLPWEGWVDLQPDAADRAGRIRSLPEVREVPELEALLIAANTAGTRTAKVDVFPVGCEEVDPEILEFGLASGLDQTMIGFGSYLDVVLADGLAPLEFAFFEQIARSTARLAKAADRKLCCAEVVLRPAHLYDRAVFGWTLYAIGFGDDAQSARIAWASAAMTLVEAWLQAVASATANVTTGE